LTRHQLRTDLPVSALPVVEDVNCFQKLGFFKIRPPCFGEIEFGVGGLPEEKVGQAMLAAGANQ